MKPTTITAEELAPLLNRPDSELLALSNQLVEPFLPEALFSARPWERVELYVKESFRHDLKRWGQKGSDLLEQLSKPEVVADVRLVAAVGSFVVSRLVGLHDIPAADLAAFSLLLIRLYRKNSKNSKHDAGI